MNNIFKIFCVVELILLFIIGLGIGLGDTLIWIFFAIIAGILCIRWGIRKQAGHLILGGVFLIFPGYITDIIGVLLILNLPLLSILANLGIISSIQKMGGGMGMNSTIFTQQFHSTKHQSHRPQKQQTPHENSDIIDGDFTRKDD